MKWLDKKRVDELLSLPLTMKYNESYFYQHNDLLVRVILDSLNAYLCTKKNKKKGRCSYQEASIYGLAGNNEICMEEFIIFEVSYLPFSPRMFWLPESYLNKVLFNNEVVR